MDKKEEFKKFVKTKPELIDFIKNGDMSWQKFYELYDLYGDDRNVWNKYNNIKKESNINFGKINDIIKGVNMDSIQEHIGTAQKALGLVQELTNKGASNISKVTKGPQSPRPINKFFGD